jgi:hypothetical protein
MAATKLTSFSLNLCSFQKEVAQPHARIDNIHAANLSISACQRVLKVPGAVRYAPLREHSSFSKGSSLHLCSAKSIGFSVSPACITEVWLHFPENYGCSQLPKTFCCIASAFRFIYELVRGACTEEI